MLDAYRHCQALVREADRDRYLASLLCQAAIQRDLFALYAFNVELSLVGDRARDPLAGEARLQWWLQALDATPQAAANPVADALLETANRHGLDREALRRMIRARMSDLFERMPDHASFENYLHDTAGALFSLAGAVASEKTEELERAAAAGGLAYGSVQLLRNFAFHAHRGKIFLPGDLLDRHGVDRETVLRGEPSPSLLEALAEMRKRAREHLADANRHVRALTRIGRLPFLPLALAEPYLRQMERPGYNPFETAVEILQWKRQWILWRASR